MWMSILGLLLGISLGLLADIQIPPEYASYLSIAVLASLDTLFGGIRAHLQQVYDDKVFVSGFFFNIVLAAGLAFLGVHLGVDLYLAAIFAFGVRLFQNIAVIRRILLSKWAEKRSLVRQIDELQENFLSFAILLRQGVYFTIECNVEKFYKEVPRVESIRIIRKFGYRVFLRQSIDRGNDQ